MAAAAALDHISNFRDVHAHCPEIRPGRLFRSGHTLFASERDADRLLGQYGIRTVIDLRTDGDAEVPAAAARKAAGGADPANRFVQRLEKVSLDVAASGRPLQTPSVTNVQFGGWRQTLAYIWQHMPLVDVLLLIVYVLLCLRHRAKAVLARALARGGLTGIYCSMVSRYGDQIAKVLKVVTVNTKDSAVMIHCSLGKDRTGVIIALILMIVGVDLDHIVADYEETAKSVSLEVRKALLPDGILDKDLFTLADGQAIRNLDQFLREKYGSLDQYLNQIGFDRAHRELLRAHLLNKKTQ